MLQPILIVGAFSAFALGCAQHDNYHFPGAHRKRAEAGKARDWEYATSYDWGSISSGGQYPSR